MRNPTVNETISQLLHIKVVAICHVNVFYVIVFRSAAYIFPNLFQKHKYHVSGIFFSFSSGWQLPKIGGKFLKMENCFSLTNRGRSTPSSPPPPSSPLDFHSKTSAFKTSPYYHPSGMVAVESLTKPQNKAQRLNVIHTRKIVPRKHLDFSVILLF